MALDSPLGRVEPRILDRAEVRRPPWRTLLPLTVVLSLSAVLLFYNAARFSMPIGSAGLYAQAAKQIAEANFGLPEQIHFYGPGDLPFAYPPLAFYVMAFFLKLGVSDVVYLRFMPPLLTLLGLPVLYLLARAITGSEYAAAAVTAICAVSPMLYGAHAWAAGAVRALAFLLLLCGLYVLQIAIQRAESSRAAVAGVILGLAGLTHLFYGLFVAAWILCSVIAKPRRPSLRVGIVCLGVAALISAPWLVLMLHRYGVAPFSYALFSHGNASFLDVLAVPQALSTWIAGHLSDITAVLLEVPLVVLGVIRFLAKREFAMPLLFGVALLLLSQEGDRFVVLLAGILAGAGSLVLGEWLHSLSGARFVAPVVLVAVVLDAAWVGVRGIQRDIYAVPDEAVALGQYVQRNTRTDTRFLFLAGPRGEWFPYLLQRRPFASKWGSEWLGTYDQQINLLASIDYCRRTRVVECVSNLRLPIQSSDVLITLKEDRDVTRGLRSQPTCPEMAAIGAYVVWNAGCLVAGGTGSSGP